MLEIRFHPESDAIELVAAAAEYQAIWDADGARIVEQLERLTGRRFAERLINALVFEGVSHSHPLCLRAGEPPGAKRAALVHELCHRLLPGPPWRPRPPSERVDPVSLEIHRLLDLFMYDAWVELYGEEFARAAVEHESAVGGATYRDAWAWALGFDRAGRAAELARRLAQPRTSAISSSST